jgi:hypothetical protein
MAAINTPTIAKNSILNFLISIPPLKGICECFKRPAEIKAGEAEQPVALPFIISPASGMQPPLVQRRSSDANMTCFQLSKAMTRALLACSSLSRSRFHSSHFETLINERLNVRERACPHRSKRYKTVMSDE